MVVLVDQLGDPAGERVVEVPLRIWWTASLRKKDRLRPRLVVDTQARLEEVGERPVPNVMDQRRDKRGTPVAGLGVIVEIFPRWSKGLLHQMEHAEAVGEPVVVGAGIGQVADTKLMDARSR